MKMTVTQEPTRGRPQPAEAIEVSCDDIEILRRLAEPLAREAARPVHKEKARMWRDLNQLRSTRPMVWINEIPWHELNVNDEMTLCCRGQWARAMETHLRIHLYQWRHFPADMVLSDYISSPICYHSTGVGIGEEVHIVRTDPANGVVSREFVPQIVDEKDIEKIRMPQVSADPEGTERQFEARCRVFGGILPVRKEGIKHLWYTPWDHLIRLWGVEQAMMDLIMRPEMVNAAVSRFAQACNHELDQFEALELLSPGNDNTRVGSGGYGYTGELPGGDFDAAHVRAHNLWGCSNAQIFSSVSPEMHWEFAIRHDLPYLSRWGLNYYGCCEPLDIKMEVARRIPRLRKVSMSPWIKPERAAQAVGQDFVFSLKPNPAPLAEDNWRPDAVRDDLKRILDQIRGCHVEIILKDVSTVRYQPQRLWEWARIAMDLAEQ